MTQGIQSQGDLFPVRHNTLVQANAGYDRDNPNFPPLAPYGALRGSPDGIGAYSRLGHMPTPSSFNSGVLGRVMAGSPLVRGMRAISGLGADDPAATPAAANTSTSVPGLATGVVAASGLLVAAVAVGLVLTGVSGYYVGKAVAPSRDRESKYAWWGVVAALAGGPIGLGIESAVALSHKGG